MLFPKHKNTIHKNPKECLANIKRKITEKTKITNFVDLGETPTDMSRLYIYSIDGRLIKTIIPTEQRLKIEDLVANNLYIVKYSNQGSSDRTTKIGKVVY